MRVLVTGGYGFIGSHVLRQLVADGHEVACFDLSGPSPVASAVAGDIEDVTGDVTDPVAVYDAVAGFEPDRIVHLAALLGRPSQRDPRRAFAVNVTGTINVLEAAGSLGVERVVAASSVASYGDGPEGRETLDETATQAPRNVYGLTKYAVEYLGETYADQRGLEFAAIQPVHGLGPDRERGNVEDAYVLKAAVDGTPLTVPAVEEPYEIVYIEDEARAFVVAALADGIDHHRYVVGTGELMTLADVARAAERLVSGAELELGDTRGDDHLEPLPPSDTARIRTDLGWEPTHTPGEAIEAYVAWLEDNPGKWTFDPDAVPWN